MTINLAFIGISLLVCVLMRFYQNERKLNSFPGPFIASCTDLWFFFQQRSGKSWNTILSELHQNYGPVVRFGPHRLSFIDPAAVGVIYGFHPLLNKSNNYASLTKVSQGKEIISFNTLNDENRHTAIKRSISSAFAPHTLLEYEDIVDENANLLIMKLREAREVDVGQWMEYFTTDTICKIAFSEDAGCLKSGSDATGFIATSAERLRHWTHWSVLPDSDRMIFRNPFVTKLFNSTSPIAAMAAAMVAKSRESTGKEIASHTDLIHKFVKASDNAPGAFGPQDVTGLVMAVITAGASTTGNTIAIALYHLSKNPQVVAILEQDLADARASGQLSNPPRFEEVIQLKYLDAIIRESMRLSPTTDHGMWRVVPPGGIDITGVKVPGGTIVEVPIPLVQRNKEIYGEDSEVYNPDRWIDASEQRKLAMEKAWISFGAGKRVCLGQNIAMLEMKKLIARLVMKFKMSLVNPSEELKMSGMFVSAPVGLKLRFENKAVDRENQG